MDVSPFWEISDYVSMTVYPVGEDRFGVQVELGHMKDENRIVVNGEGDTKEEAMQAALDAAHAKR